MKRFTNIMKRRYSWIIITILMTFFLTANAQAIPLTNSLVTELDVDSLFDFGSLIDMVDPFDIFPPTLGGDGVVESGYIPGISGTAAEGLYLYFYKIDVFPTSSDQISAITFDFMKLYTGLDINGDGLADTSFYCSDCGGVIPPTAATYTPATNAIRFIFLDPSFDPTLNPGGFSTYFGAVSPAIPGIVEADLLDSGGTSLADVYAPVPEPASLLLLGSGLLGVALLGVRKRKI